jgi:hypothetical protein
MNLSVGTVATLALVLVTARSGVASGAQRRDPPRDQQSRAAAGDGRITGRVFDAVTNTPIRRAKVQANDGDLVVDATTDDDGRFDLAGLSRGDWTVSISKAGYLTTQLGQRHALDTPSPITVAAGQHVTVDVPLARGGVVTGKVYEDGGEPLAGLRVRVHRMRTTEGVRRLEAIGADDFTDDTGAYRIYGLPPGDYVVTASLRVAPPDSIVDTTYAPTYYPGTGDAAQAQRVRVDVGAEATAIFPLLPIRRVRVSGSVMASSGLPADAFLSLVSESTDAGGQHFGGVTAADGTFTLVDVPPGDYKLVASLRGNGPSESASIALLVGNEDIVGAALTTSRPATLRGRISADAAGSREIPDNLEVVAFSTGASGSVLASDSGPAFRLDDLDEPFFLRVDGLPEGWMIKSIVVNGLDVTDAPISIPLAQEGDAHIVVTDRAGKVEGTAISSLQARRVAVVVFPEDRRKWTFPSRYVRATTTDDQGRFRFAGLPGGESYLALAIDWLHDGEHTDPDFLERVSGTASRFRLAESATHTLGLPVIAR